MLWVGLPVWYFFGILFRPGMDLRKDFLDMAYTLLFFLYCLFPYSNGFSFSLYSVISHNNYHWFIVRHFCSSFYCKKRMD